jgi:tetratricopeptide (TPR) repeat protein
MHINWRPIAMGCALVGFVVFDGFSILCAAQPARAEVNEPLQPVEWCEAKEADISYDLGIRGCSEVIRLGNEAPKNLAFAFTNRGNGYVLKGEYDRAIADYTEAIKLDPNFAAAYNGRAGAYSDQGDVDRAVADYAEGRRLALGNADDRTVFDLQKGHMPAVTVKSEPPTPAVTALSHDNRTTGNATDASSRSNPIIQSSVRVFDAQDQNKERIAQPGKQPSVAGGSPSQYRADNDTALANTAVGQLDFVFADSDVRHLTRIELQKLSEDQLQIARNEIFARRGRYFKDDRLSSYFAKLAWYRPAVWDVPLNPIEKANVDFIQSLEARTSNRRR